MITKQDYEILGKYTKEFSRVLDSQYKLPTPMSQDEEVLAIVRKYEPKFQHRWGCSHCSFELYKRAGMMYRDYKPEVQPKDEEEVIPVVKKPRSRRKKSE